MKNEGTCPFCGGKLIISGAGIKWVAECRGCRSIRISAESYIDLTSKIENPFFQKPNVLVVAEEGSIDYDVIARTHVACLFYKKGAPKPEVFPIERR